jgi:uncharacterized membrane protein SpoIIM required for sporulation
MTMKVADRLAKREEAWHELDFLVNRFESGRIRRSRARAPEVIWIDAHEADYVRRWRERSTSDFDELVRMADLYRSACADLMLAEAHDLPRDTVAYLHALVARAHNVLYRSRGLGLSRWARTLMVDVPRRLRSDPMLKIALLAFYGTFVLFGLLGMGRPGFAQQIVGEGQIAAVRQMYSEASWKHAERNDATMAGFYILNNARVGLMCYAWGLLLGVGSLYVMIHEGVRNGAIFGYMATTSDASRFFTFVTAHGPFELTAIVFSGAAGLRLGMGMVITKGQTRLASLQREARESLPIAASATVLFVLAAFLEGFISASALPYAVKAAIAITSALLLIVYVALGGRERRVAESS